MTEIEVIRMSSKGQIVIPQEMRKTLGLKKGNSVLIELRDKEVVIKPEQDPEEFLKDFLNIPEKLRSKKPLRIKDIKDMIEEQYEL